MKTLVCSRMHINACTHVWPRACSPTAQIHTWETPLFRKLWICVWTFYPTLGAQYAAICGRTCSVDSYSFSHSKLVHSLFPTKLWKSKKVQRPITCPLQFCYPIALLKCWMVALSPRGSALDFKGHGVICNRSLPTARENLELDLWHSSGSTFSGLSSVAVWVPNWIHKSQTQTITSCSKIANSQVALANRMSPPTSHWPWYAEHFNTQLSAKCWVLCHSWLSMLQERDNHIL